MKLSITIETDNAAFEDDFHGEVKRVLDSVNSKLELVDNPKTQIFGAVLFDSNGNRVGNATITGE